ncbi:MAG TPA: hypothetical protein VHC49_03245 [Mycobacteriales bacterium]|nr:hypothetical protein [Mycobacteriales bacterium]
MRPARSLVLTAAAAAVVAAGCSGGGNSGSADNAGIRGMLDRLPAAGDSRTGQVIVDLYADAAKAGPVAVPKPGASPKDVQRYGLALSKAPIAVGGSSLFQELTVYGQNSRKLNGFDLSNITADACISDPPEAFVAARGEFDSASVDHALRDEPAWKSELTVQKHDGTTVLRWGKDNVVDIKKVRTGIFTSIGRSRRIALPDDHTFLYSPTDAGISALLDKGKTLADLAPYRSAADVLDDQHAYSAIFLHRSPATQALGDEELLAVGVNRSSVLVVVVSPDADAAKTATQRLRATMKNGRTRYGMDWSELVGSPKITTTGNVTTMTVTSGKVRPRWFTLPQEQLFTTDSPPR